MIKTSPRLDDGTPFPTLYWLTCRELSKCVGRLEAGGFMASINQRLIEDEEMRARLSDSTERYVAERDTIERLGADGHPGGGPAKIKCLHAHVGHHLVTGDNPVGAAALEDLRWADPSEPCVHQGEEQ